MEVEEGGAITVLAAFETGAETETSGVLTDTGGVLTETGGLLADAGGVLEVVRVLTNTSVLDTTCDGFSDTTADTEVDTGGVLITDNKVLETLGSSIADTVLEEVGTTDETGTEEMVGVDTTDCASLTVLEVCDTDA